jgi:hypothetical protein
MTLTKPKKGQKNEGLRQDLGTGKIYEEGYEGERAVYKDGSTRGRNKDGTLRKKRSDAKD